LRVRYCSYTSFSLVSLSTLSRRQRQFLLYCGSDSISPTSTSVLTLTKSLSILIMVDPLPTPDTLTMTWMKENIAASYNKMTQATLADKKHRNSSTEFLRLDQLRYHGIPDRLRLSLDQTPDNHFLELADLTSLMSWKL